MRYLGGKSRLGGRIVQAILDDLGIKRLTLAVDLCSGAGGVTHRLADVSDRVIAVEAHPGLVALMRAVQGGWVPPQNVTREEYKASFALPVEDPLATFMGFGCAFAGDWRHGFAFDNSGKHNYALQAGNALRRDNRVNVEHVNADATLWAVPEGLQVAYCDPPYEGTSGYAAVPTTQPAGTWWRRLAEIASPTCACYLSEYADAPPAGVEARQVWEAQAHGNGLTKGTKTERLWRVLGWAQGWDAHLEREAV